VHLVLLAFFAETRGTAEAVETPDPFRPSLRSAEVEALWGSHLERRHFLGLVSLTNARFSLAALVLALYFSVGFQTRFPTAVTM